MRTASGLVFDIRRFSVHDGKGIRTTVFLKGCPLRCRWCQNPEGLEEFLKPVWLSGACIRCGDCTKTAAAWLYWEKPQKINDSVLQIKYDPDTESDFQRNEENQFWDAVMNVCPAKALVWNGRTMTVDEVLAEAEKDRVFYAHSGGCTLSGGEPLAQGDFALALLEKCRKAGIHTAIETSLLAPADIVNTAAELSDQIFADCKILDEKKHIEATGQSNKIILHNLEQLLLGKHSGKLTVRTPLIPGFTADTQNIRAIADFIYARNAAVPYELLNYNPLAESKYPYGDLQWPEPRARGTNPYSAEQMENFKAIIRERGMQCIE